MSSSPASTSSSTRRGVFILLEGLDRSGKSSQCVKLAQNLNTEKASSAVQMRFPDRETAIGKMIDAYLKQSTEIDDQSVATIDRRYKDRTIRNKSDLKHCARVLKHCACSAFVVCCSTSAIHLLFSANRWEKNSSMLAALQAGQHLVVDRYAYSGIAFTTSKQVHNPSLTLTWTTTPDRGLIAPDVVLFLDISSEDAAKRGSFGEERYEKKEIQDRVRKLFGQLRTQAGLPVGEKDANDGESFGVGVEWNVVNAGQTMEQVEKDILQLAKQAIEKYQDQSVKYL